MKKRRVLYVVHGHPDFSPGGAEIYAFELHRAMQARAEFDSVLLARVGPQPGVVDRAHLGARITSIASKPGQYLALTDTRDYDYLWGTLRDKRLCTHDFPEFLAAIQPDIVHFQHTLHLGYDLLRVTRNTLPTVPILYTLHEFLPMCLSDGQMVTTRDHELCKEATPPRCARCFPERSPIDFFLRKRFIQSHLQLVDCLITPSEFLRQRYIDWGIPEESIIYEPNGRALPPPLLAGEKRPTRNLFGFFGQLGPYKGIDILLQAIQRLAAEDAADDRRPTAHLSIHGTGLELHPPEFQQRINDLMAATRDCATFFGRYSSSELPALMHEIDWVVVPSIWWENSPLVIQEAFHFGRPVICGNIGGMAEKVRDGIDGLHYRVGDVVSLTNVLRRAAETPDLWDELHQGIQPVYSMKDAAQRMASIYTDLMRERTRRLAVANLSAVS
jgi:glycosyltransferase involved in cell wall biosynthesis